MNANELIFSKSSIIKPEEGDGTEIITNSDHYIKTPRIKNAEIRNNIEDSALIEFDYLDDEYYEYIHSISTDNSPYHSLIFTISCLERISSNRVLFSGLFNNKIYRVYVEDEWAQLFPFLQNGLKVRIIFSEEIAQDLDSIVINKNNNFLVLEPTLLIPSTLLADSFGCLRRCILSMRTQAAIEDKRPTSTLVVGSICHEIFGEIFENKGMCCRFTRNFG